MSSFLGMDPDSAKSLAKKMNSAADQIKQAVHSLTSEVSHVQWKGKDADHFKHEWSGNVGKITHITDVLRTTATTLNKQAAEQERTSSN